MKKVQEFREQIEDKFLLDQHEICYTSSMVFTFICYETQFMALTLPFQLNAIPGSHEFCLI